MSKIVNLEGKKFGRLTAISLADKESLGIKSYGRWWKCQCDCGNITYVKTSDLTGGFVRSCGCLRNEKAAERLKTIRKNQFIDLTGKKFGKLTVIKRASDRNKKSYWLCKCDCGKEIEVAGRSLREGKVADCGCMKPKQSYNFKDMAGQRIGSLVVIERANDYITKGKNRITMWKCQCDCGNIFVTSGQNLREGRVTNCGCVKEEK